MCSELKDTMGLQRRELLLYQPNFVSRVVYHFIVKLSWVYDFSSSILQIKAEIQLHKIKCCLIDTPQFASLIFTRFHKMQSIIKGCKLWHN